MALHLATRTTRWPAAGRRLVEPCPVLPDDRRRNSSSPPSPGSAPAMGARGIQVERGEVPPAATRMENGEPGFCLGVERGARSTHARPRHAFSRYSRSTSRRPHPSARPGERLAGVEPSRFCRAPGPWRLGGRHPGTVSRRPSVRRDLEGLERVDAEGVVDARGKSDARCRSPSGTRAPHRACPGAVASFGSSGRSGAPPRSRLHAPTDERERDQSGTPSRSRMSGDPRLSRVMASAARRYAETRNGLAPAARGDRRPVEACRRRAGSR